MGGTYTKSSTLSCLFTTFLVIAYIVLFLFIFLFVKIRTEDTEELSKHVLKKGLVFPLSTCLELFVLISSTLWCKLTIEEFKLDFSDDSFSLN